MPALLTFALALTGCSQSPVRSTDNPAFVKAYQARFTQLRGVSNWTLQGRLAISDGKDGGSGNLSWSQNSLETLMSFRGTLGKGAWQLKADQNGARLELADGSIHRAPTVAELVLKQVGWKVPVDALAWWVKGLIQPGDWDVRELDELGRVRRLGQSGWDVEIGSYVHAQEYWLPGKLTARQGKYLVKLAVRNWRLPGEGPGLD